MQDSSQNQNARKDSFEDKDLEMKLKNEYIKTKKVDDTELHVHQRLINTCYFFPNIWRSTKIKKKVI